MLVYEFMPNGTLRDWLSGFEFSGNGLSKYFISSEPYSMLVATIICLITNPLGTRNYPGFLCGLIDP